MAHSYKDMIVAAFNNIYKSGITLQEVCFGGKTTRRCAVSNGMVFDQKLEGNRWINTETVAEGYSS
jgi:hypothetical protein